MFAWLHTCWISITKYLGLRTVVGICGGLLAYFFGTNIIAYSVVFVLAMGDMLTGVMVAVKEKRLSSVKFFRKFPVLVAYMIALGAAHQIALLEDSLKWVQTSIALGLAMGECLSILENLARLDVKLPAKIKSFFAEQEKELR